jgi:hypothetical protein
MDFYDVFFTITDFAIFHNDFKCSFYNLSHLIVNHFL